MMNMQQMMKQAQKLQKQLEKGQAELASTKFIGKSAQDLVTAVFTGDRKLVSVTFKEGVVDPQDIENLADLTIQAVNHALEQIEVANQKNLGAFAGKLPF